MAQTNWNSFGTPTAQLNGVSSVGQNIDGRLVVFVSSQRTGELWHLWQTTPNGTWSSWDSLYNPPGTGFSSNAAVGQNADGRLEVFLIGYDGVLWHRWQTAPGGSWYPSWFSSGKPSAANLQYDPTVVNNTDGRLEVFAVDTNGILWHLWQTTPNGTWSSWDSLGKPSTLDLGFPMAAKNADGRIEVFTVGNGALWHRWQTAPGGSWYPSWFSSGQPSLSIPISIGVTALSQNADGRLEIFAVGTDGAFWHLWQTTPNGTWSAWDRLGKPGTVEFSPPPTIGRNQDGRLEPLLIGNDGALWHLWQTSPGSTWSGWDSLGAPSSVGLTLYSVPAVSANADGRLEVFALSDGNTLWHAWQVTPGGPWG
jgi:hypothetical protein